MRLLVVVAVACSLALAGCSGATPTGDGATAPSTGAASSGPAADADAIDAAAALATERYELVRDGDYTGACALYSEAYAALFEELAESTGKSCVEAHEAAAKNVADYLGTASDQGRAGLTPFFYVPSAISIDLSKISAEGDDVAYLAPGALVSLDPTAFEDGTGKTPGWLNGQDYVKRGADGSWHFVAATEK